VVLTNPHNPSCVLLSREDVAEIGRLAAAAGTTGASVLVTRFYRDNLVFCGAAVARPPGTERPCHSS